MPRLVKTQTRDRGPLRGDVGARRGGRRARRPGRRTRELAVVGKPAPAPGRRAARRRRGALHGRRRPAGDAADGRAALAARPRARRVARPRRGARGARRARGASGPSDELVAQRAPAADGRGGVRRRRPSPRSPPTPTRRPRPALRALAPQWEVLPFSISVDEAIAEQRFRGEPEEVVRGDVDAALARADVRIEFALETPGHLQTPLEPHGAVAWWQDDELTAWVSTQGMFAARDELCRRFGIERERVRVQHRVRRRRLRRQAGRRARGAAGGRAVAADRPAGAARQRPPRASSSTAAAAPRRARPCASARRATGARRHRRRRRSSRSARPAAHRRC